MKLENKLSQNQNLPNWRDIAQIAVALVLGIATYFLQGVDCRLRGLEITVARIEERIKTVEKPDNLQAINYSMKSNR